MRQLRLEVVRIDQTVRPTPSTILDIFEEKEHEKNTADDILPPKGELRQIKRNGSNTYRTWLVFPRGTPWLPAEGHYLQWYVKLILFYSIMTPFLMRSTYSMEALKKTLL